MIQHSKSMQKDAYKSNFEQKIDVEYFYDIVWCDFAS